MKGIILAGGLGTRLEQAGGDTVISGLVAGGAADRDGRLQPGDVIVEVTDRAGQWTAAAGKPLQDVRGLIVGDAGNKVSLRIRRTQEKGLREITLTRAPLPLQTNSR